MKKEIGSIFPIYSTDCPNGNPLQDNRVYMSLCREALLHIAKQPYANKVVLMPAYTCDTVYLPFLQEGWTLQFYSINRDLRINIDSLEQAVQTFQPSIVIAHPYFGYDFDAQEVAALTRIKNATIIVDNTQCAFTQQRYAFADYTVASLRKWGAVPDGAYMEGASRVSCLYENDAFVHLQKKAMELRGDYFQTEDTELKSESIQLNKKAESLICSNIQEHAMSRFSQNRYAGWNIDAICQKRMANYVYLHEHISGIGGVKPVRTDISGLTTAPLYFPIYCENRAAVQKRLAEKAIYCPVIWPIDDEFVLIDDEVKYIYDHILCLIVDQRYTETEMQQIINIICKSQK